VHTGSCGPCSRSGRLRCAGHLTAPECEAGQPLHHVKGRNTAQPQLHFFARRTNIDGGWESSAEQDRPSELIAIQIYQQDNDTGEEQGAVFWHKLTQWTLSKHYKLLYTR